MAEFYIGYILSIFIIILISMTIHEAMHAYVGYWLGDDTAEKEERLTFNPISHIDPFLTIILPVMLALTSGTVFGGAKPVPFNPANVRFGEFGAMLVGIAGPLTNLLIAFICFGIYSIVPVSFQDIFLLAVTINLGFFVFNMIPIPPLDGSRVLYYLAPESIRRVMAAMEVYGIIIVFAVVLLFSPYLVQYLKRAIDFFLAIFATIFGSVL